MGGAGHPSIYQVIADQLDSQYQSAGLADRQPHSAGGSRIQRSRTETFTKGSIVATAVGGGFPPVGIHSAAVKPPLSAISGGPPSTGDLSGRRSVVYPHHYIADTTPSHCHPSRHRHDICADGNLHNNDYFLHHNHVAHVQQVPQPPPAVPLETLRQVSTRDDSFNAASVFPQSTRAGYDPPVIVGPPESGEVFIPRPPSYRSTATTTALGGGGGSGIPRPIAGTFIFNSEPAGSQFASTRSLGHSSFGGNNKGTVTVNSMKTNGSPTGSARRHGRAHKRRSGVDPPAQLVGRLPEMEPGPESAVSAETIAVTGFDTRYALALAAAGPVASTTTPIVRHSPMVTAAIAPQQSASPVSSTATTAAPSPFATPRSTRAHLGPAPIQPWETKLLPWSVQWNPPLTDMAARQVPTLPASKAYVETMCALLEHIVAEQPAYQLSPRSPALRFDAVSVPAISIKDYLMRLYSFFSCSTECFVLAMVYIDRLLRLHPTEFTLTGLNIHRILLTAVTLAAKYFDDVYYSNSYYAKVGGLSAQELSSLESHFLSLIKYDLFVCSREFEKYRRDVTQLHAVTQGMDPAEPAAFFGDTADYQAPGPGVRLTTPPEAIHKGSTTTVGYMGEPMPFRRNSSAVPVSISSTQCSTPIGAPMMTSEPPSGSHPSYGPGTELR